MSERRPRIAYACGCPGTDCISDHQAYLWSNVDVGSICENCHQPVRAYNLDRLLRIEEKARKFDAAALLGHQRYAWDELRELRDALAEPGERKE